MRRLFVLVAAVVLVDTMFYAAITPLLPAYRDELGLSKTAAGVLTAAYPAGTLVASLPSGYLAARVGVKATMIAGLAVMAAASVVFAFAQDIVVLDVARFAQGVGGACSWTGGLAWLIGAAPEERRGELIGSAIAAAVAGTMLGPVLGGAATLSSPELVFSGVAVLGVVLIAATLTLPSVARARPPSLRAVARAARGPAVATAFWLVSLPALFAGVIEVLGPLRLDELGASTLVVGATFLIAAAVEATMSPFVGRFSDRRGRMAPIRIGLAAAVPIGLAVPLAGAVALEAVLIVAVVAALAAFWAPAMAMLSDASEAAGLEQGFALAFTNLAWAGGHVGGGAVGGGLADLTSDFVPYAAMVALCALTLAEVHSRGRRGRETVAG